MTSASVTRDTDHSDHIYRYRSRYASSSSPFSLFVSADLFVFFSLSPLSSHLSYLSLPPPSSSSSSISLLWLRVKLPLDVLSSSPLALRDGDLAPAAGDNDPTQRGEERGRQTEREREKRGRVQQRKEIKEMYRENREG